MRALERRATASHAYSPHESDPVSASVVAEGHEETQLDTDMGDPDVDRHDRQRETPNRRDHASSRSAMVTSTKSKAHQRQASVWTLSGEVCRILGIEPNRQSCDSVDDTEALQTLSPEEPRASLPQHDYIVHLAHVVDFHLHASCLFDGYPVSTRRVDDTMPSLSNTESKIWYMQVSAVIALGRLFLEKGGTGSRPPGFQEFLQGMNAVPSNAILCQYPLVATEALCLFAVYAEAANMHAVAYLYISQAVAVARCCNLDGQKEVSEEIESGKVETARRLWYTGCILDQRYSAAICVVPNYPTQDGDRLFSDGRQDLASDTISLLNLAITCHLTRLITIHSKHEVQNAGLSLLVEELMVEIGSLHSLGQHLSTLPHFRFGRSLHAISRPAATLHLLYCQCVIVAAQPVLLQLLQRHLSRDELPISTSSLPETPFAILRACADAASLALHIMSVLHEQHLLEAFLFSNVEMTFMAALALALISFILPNTGSDLVDKATTILHDIGQSGNAVASALGDDLKRIHKALSAYPGRERGDDAPSLEQEAAMKQDGESFNIAFLNLLKIPKPSKQGSQVHETHQSDPVTIADAIEVPYLDQSQGPQATTQDSNWGSAPQQAVSSLVQPEDLTEVSLDEAEDAYSFNMLDLEWLEYVQ